MDEMLITAEESQPEVQTAEEETASAQDTATETDSSVMAATPTDETDTGGQNAEPYADDGDVFSVKHNKQMRILSRDDVVGYAQKGFKYDDLQPVLETLKYVAASEGKTLAEFAEAIREQSEKDLYSRLLDRCGDEEIAKELLEVEKGKHKKAFEALVAQEQTVEEETEEAINTRMAEEFSDLRREFPQYTEFSKIPQQVVRDAIAKGIPLLDAQLRYEHRERVKAEKAQSAQAAAAKATVGEQHSTDGNTPSAVETALLKGIWG